MNTVLLPAADGENLDQAADLLHHGGLVAFPTDTVYGLGALPFNEGAVARLYEVKARHPDKAIPVLIASSGDLDLVAARVGRNAMRLAERFWPGPLTLVVPKNARIPEIVAGPTVGIRVPNHPVALALLRLAGPLAVSSANISGAASPISAAEVMGQLGDRVEMILDGGIAPGGTPSTVVDCTGTDLVILRPGPLLLEELQAALG